MRHRDEGCRVRAGPGDVLFVMPDVPYGLDPDGEVEVTRVFASAEVMVECVRLAHPQYRLDSVTAPLFARRMYPEASQMVSIGRAGRAALFDDLDGLARLTAGRVLQARWVEATSYFFGAAMWLAPQLATGPGWVLEDQAVLESKPTQASFYWLRPLSPQVRQARALIDASFTRALTAAWLARQVSMSVSGLRHRFAAETGKTPRAYLLSLRVQQMARLLLATDWSVERIARDVGWADRGNAVDVFTQAAGVSPSEFRRRFRTGGSCWAGGGAGSLLTFHG